MTTLRDLMTKDFDTSWFDVRICQPRNRLVTIETDPTPADPPWVVAERAQQALRIVALERQVQLLQKEVREIRSFVVNHPVSQQRSGLIDPRISSVVQTTEQLFAGSSIEIEMEVDPSEPEQPFVVFKVNCSGELEEILAKEMEWNRRVREAESGYSGQLRLLVCPTE